MAQEEAEEAVAVEVAARYFRHTSQTRCQIPLRAHPCHLCLPVHPHQGPGRPSMSAADAVPSCVHFEGGE